ncbi:hypothetical protein [Sphingomonas faeni]|uniref:hypothetical protein n=1 Tax=Sphingomonas faeni TaxID=185950 RepID=UPI003358F85F
MSITRQPAGRGGAKALRELRDKQRREGLQAVLTACNTLIHDGTRPSIVTVANASGMSTSSMNRERYKSVIRSGRMRYDCVASGMSFDEALALIGESAVQPDREDAEGGDADDARVMDPAALSVKLERLTSDLTRRDEQLYYTLGLVESLRATLRWHRATLADMVIKLDAVNDEPIEARKPQKWREDMLSVPFDPGDLSDDDDDNDDD